MSSHRGIALAALCFVLAITVAACSGPDEDPPPTPGPYSPAPYPTDRRKIDVTVAHPKRVDEHTRCYEIITADDVGAATNAVARPGGSQSSNCSYTLDKHRLAGAGEVNFVFSAIDPAASATVTTLAGNTAVEVRLDERTCDFFVVLDGNKSFAAEGGALYVKVRRHLPDLGEPCKVARELVEKGFARLPDA